MPAGRAPRAPAPHEFFSVNHPDFQRAEGNIRIREMLKEPDDGARSLPHLRQLLKNLQHDETGAKVFDAIRDVGLDALCEDPSFEEQSGIAEHLRLYGEIRSIVWARVRGWYAGARYASTVSDRSRAAAQLKRLGAALAGKRKGMRTGVLTDRLTVRVDYRHLLYRVERAIKLLPVWPWPALPRERVRLVFEACGVDVHDFRYYLDDGLPTRLLQWPRMAVRESIARRFAIKESTLSTLLSRTRLPK